jgi:hypothetical protein
MRLIPQTTEMEILGLLVSKLSIKLQTRYQMIHLNIRQLMCCSQRGQIWKTQVTGRSASPIPSPPKGKRVRTNDRPRLIGKRGHRSKAEMAADKAAKAAKATIATATEERALTELAELELEQAKMSTARREAVIHQYRTNDEDHDRLQAEMDTGEDLTGLIDKEMEAFDDDDSEDGSDSGLSASDEDGVESGAKKGMSKKVSYIPSFW